jgi:hypothetical protein
VRQSTFVPPVLRIAPDDTAARQLGEELENYLRGEIKALRALAKVPQPRWLFSQVQSGEAQSMRQLCRAFVILSQHTEVPVERLQEVWARLGALAMSLRPIEDACPETLHIEDSEAEGPANVLQLRAAQSGWKDRAAVERAFEATVHQEQKLVRFKNGLARLLYDAFQPAQRRFIGRQMR